MTASLKGKLVAGFVLAFLAGAATGAFFTLHQARNWRADLGRHSHSLAERMRDRIKTQLDLTPDQLARIDPILDHAAGELQQIRQTTGAQVREVMSQANQAIRPLLTDAQRAKLTRIEQNNRAKRGPRNGARHRSSRPAKPDPGEAQGIQSTPAR
jgi:hypothetical protein